MSEHKLYESFNSLIKCLDTPGNNYFKCNSEIKLSKKYQIAFINFNEIYKDLKILQKIDRLDFSSDMDLPDRPDIKYLTEGEVEKKKKDVLSDFSAYVTISQKKIEVWLNNELESKGLVIGDIEKIQERYPEPLEQYLDKPIHNSMNYFHLAGASLTRHRLFVYIPRKLVLDLPIYIELQHSQSSSFFPVHLVNIVGDESSCIEYISARSIENSKKASIAELIVENEIGTYAKFEVFENQKFTTENINYVIHEQANVHSNAEFRKFLYDHGAKSVVRSLITELADNGSAVTITGLYSIKGNQSYTYDTTQNHYASNTTSDLLFKGVLRENSNVLWRGNIFVDNGTHAADGYQMNNNLLLDTSAKVESIPGLEILTDDVRCSHGVTIGNIDRDQVFYLKSRGIDEAFAIELIVNGFFESTLNRVNSDNLVGAIKKDLLEI